MLPVTKGIFRISDVFLCGISNRWFRSSRRQIKDSLQIRETSTLETGGTEEDPCNSEV